MSIRRINSTGRMRIAREDARFFVLADSDGKLMFEATLALGNYELQPEADVFVEAYRQTTLMRFPHGTIAAPHPPPAAARLLTEFSTGDGILFRVRVTSTGDRAGVLLAEGDRIPCSDSDEESDNRVALLPPAPDDLGQEIWRVDLSGADGPLLLINMRVGDWKSVAASPMFRSLVYPAAMRQVLWHVYKVEETRTMDDADDWRCRWFMFAAALPGVGDPPLTSGDDGEWDEWIDNVVGSFTRRHQMLEHYRAHLPESSI